MHRIVFKNKKVCSEFFEEIKGKSEIKNWRRLGQIIGTSRSMIDNYRTGKLSLPENRFYELLNRLDDNRKEYFLILIKKIDSNWGQIIGGKKAYLINRKIFDRGREIALKNKQVKYDFDINIPLSKDLCEFIGAFIGDGFTNKYVHLYQTQITGDSNLDSDYYYNVLKPICEKLFKIPPKISQKEGWIRLTIYSKRLFELLTKRFNFPAGKKSYSVCIPEEILNEDEHLLYSTIRGMFDTDGGVGFDRRESYKKPYIRINYTSSSEKLIRQLDNILTNLGVNHSLHKKGNAFMIQINGEKNIKNFISKIGFSNKRHLSKIDKIV